MGFLLKFKLLWLLSLGLLTQAHIIQRRTIKDTEDTPKLVEALRTPQKYIIEPIQTLTKNADNVEVPPYDAVDFEVEDKFNEIEGEIENSNLEVFKQNVDKVIKTVDDLDKSSLSVKESEKSDDVSKFTASTSSENNSESTQTGEIPTHLTSDRTTQTSQNNSENIEKLQSSVNSENILDTKTTQTEKESQTNLSPSIVTGTPDVAVASELKSDVDLKNLFSDLVQSVDKDKLLQTYGDNNSNIKNPNTDDSVIEDLTYQNNQLRNIGNLKDSEKQLEDSEIVTKSNEIKSPGSNDSEGHDYEVLTKLADTKSPFSASTTKDSEFIVNPTESEFGVDSKSSDFAFKSKDSEVLFNLGASSASSFKTKNSEKVVNPTEFELVTDSTALKTKNSEKALNPTEFELVSVSTALKTKDSENVLNPTELELVTDSIALKTKDSENVLSPTDSELIVDSKLPVSVLKPQDSEVLFSLGESKSRATALNTKGSKKVSRPINSENTFSGLTYSNEKDNFFPTYENIKTSKKTNSAIKNNRIRNLENSKNSEKPSQITSETKTEDFETLINPTETKSTASTSDDLNIKDSETVTKTSESSIPISEIVTNPSESELPFDSKNLFSDQVALVDDKVLPTYANENSEFKIPNKDSETDNSLVENVSNNFNGLRILEIVNPDDTKNIQLKTKTDSETPIFLSVLSELPNSENLPKSYLRNVLAENSEKVAELSELPFDSENQFSDLVSTEKYSESKIPNKVSETDNSVVESLSNNLNGLRNLEIVNPDDTKNFQLKTKTESETPVFTSVLSDIPNSENAAKTHLRNVLAEDSETVKELSNKEDIKVTNSESLDSKVLNSENVPQNLEPGKVSEATNTVTKQTQNLPENNKNSETPETLELVRVSETTNTAPNQIQKLPDNFKTTESTIATEFINSEKVPETLTPIKGPETINTVTNQIQKLTETTKISEKPIALEFINSEKAPETLETVKTSETTDTVSKFENSEKVVENIKPTAEKATENVNNATVAKKPQINSENSLATSVDTKAPKKTSENISPILETSGNIEKPLINTASTQNVDDTLTNPTNSVTGHLSSDNKSDVSAVSAETLKPNKPVFALPKPEAQPKPVKTTRKPIDETNEKPVKTTKKPISAPTEKPVKTTRKPIAATNENRVKTTIKPIVSTTEKLVKVVYISTTSKPIKEITPTVLNTRPPTTKQPSRTTTATRRPSTTRRSTATIRPSATRRPATTKKPISPAADPQQNLANQQNVPQRRPVRPKPSTPVTTPTPATNPGLFPNFPSLPPHFQNFPTLPPSLQNFPSLPPHPLNQNLGSVSTQRPPTNPSWFSNLPSLPPNLQNLPSLQNFPNLPLPPVNHQNPSSPMSSDPQQNPSNNQNRPQRRPVNSNHNTPVTTQRPPTNTGWFQNFPSLPPNLQNFPRLPTSPVNQNQGASAANQRPPTNPTRFPNLPPNLQNLSPNLQNFPNLSSPPVLPAFFVNPFNTTTSTNNQTQSTFGIGFLAVPWNWRPRNFTNIFTPNRVLDDAPAVTPQSPLNDSEETPEVARDLAFWNALFHRGFSNNSGVFKQWPSGPKLNDTPSTNATTTSFWKPWSSDFFKIPKFNYSSFNTTATIPSNTQVLHLYLPLKYPFQGQIVTSPSQRKNDETITSSISNKLEFIPKFQRSSIKSEDAAKKTKVIADTDKLVGEEKASLMFELELPKPIVQFVKGIMDTFWTQAS